MNNSFKKVSDLVKDILKTYDQDSEVTFIEVIDTPSLQEVTDDYVIIKFPKIKEY